MLLVPREEPQVLRVDDVSFDPRKRRRSLERESLLLKAFRKFRHKLLEDCFAVSQEKGLLGEL